MLSFEGCCFSRLMPKRRSHERLSAKRRSAQIAYRPSATPLAVGRGAPEETVSGGGLRRGCRRLLAPVRDKEGIGAVPRAVPCSDRTLLPAQFQRAGTTSKSLENLPLQARHHQQVGQRLARHLRRRRSDDGRDPGPSVAPKCGAEHPRPQLQTARPRKAAEVRQFGMPPLGGSATRQTRNSTWPLTS